MSSSLLLQQCPACLYHHITYVSKARGVTTVNEQDYYYYYYYFIACKFFPLALAGGLALESKRQQVSSCLQDSSQYSSHTKLCFYRDDKIIFPSILQRRLSSCLYFDKISTAELLFVKLSRFFEVLSFSLLSSPHVWLCPLPIFPRTCNFTSLLIFLLFSWFDSSIPFIICLLPLLIVNMAHFSMTNSIPISRLHVFNNLLSSSSVLFLIFYK